MPEEGKQKRLEQFDRKEQALPTVQISTPEPQKPSEEFDSARLEVPGSGVAAEDPASKEKEAIPPDNLDDLAKPVLEPQSDRAQPAASPPPPESPRKHRLEGIVKLEPEAAAVANADGASANASAKAISPEKLLSGPVDPLQSAGRISLVISAPQVKNFMLSQ